MELGNRIEIIDKEGWRKEFTFQKRLIFIGADRRNDITLDPGRGADVAPRHLQLINETSGAYAGCRAVNLSSSAIPVNDSPDTLLSPGSAMAISNGDTLRLGDFKLIIRLENAGIATSTGIPVGEPAMHMTEAGGSASIGLRIALARVTLIPDIPLEGTLYIANLGSMPGVQFNLKLEGLPSDCVKIGPAPILFPGAERGVPFSLCHPRSPAYPAGLHKILISAEARDAYPGEYLTVSQEIRISPFYHHSLRLHSTE